MKQAASLPGKQDANDQCCPCGTDTSGGTKDRRKCHDCECDVRNVVQKGAYCPVFYFFADQCQRKYTDQVGHECHDTDIEINVSVHCLIPP